MIKGTTTTKIHGLIKQVSGGWAAITKLHGLHTRQILIFDSFLVWVADMLAS